MHFTLRDDYITLQQLLKACDIVSSGGQAKVYLETKKVLVNGQPENRRGKKIVAGDVVTLEEGTIAVE